MRILHCIPSMLNGGTERQLGYLVAGQVRRGSDVSVVLLQGGPNLDRLSASGARICCLFRRTKYDPRLLTEMIRLIRRGTPDIVHTWLPLMDVVGGLASRLTGVPWVLSERSSSQAYPFTLWNGLRAAFGASAQAVVSNSKGGDAYWESRLRRPRRRYVIPNVLPLDEIAQAPPVSLDTIGLETGRKMLLHVGRLSPEKNLGSLILALRHAVTRAAFTAYLCGDGPHQGWTEELIQAQGLSGQVRLTGYRGDVRGWMKRADAFISVSTFEGSANAVLEAVACGCPLVLSDIPAHRAIVGEHGAFFVNPGSPESIAEGIVRVLSESAEAKRRAEIARTSIRHVSVAEAARQYEEVYQSVMIHRR